MGETTVKSSEARRPGLRSLGVGVLFALMLPLPVAMAIPFHYPPGEEFIAIPDAATAIKVGGAILRAHMGDAVIDKREPVEARLLPQDVWEVYCFERNTSYLGGGLYVILSKKDGRVLEMGYEK